MKPEFVSKDDLRSFRPAPTNRAKLSEEIDIEERRRRAIAVAGRFHSGAPDISTKHDEYLFADTRLNPCARLFYGQRLVRRREMKCKPIE
jgi:hypothetical protein